MNEHRTEIETLRDEVSSVAARLDAIIARCTGAERQSLLLARAEANTLVDELDEVLRRADSVRPSKLSPSTTDGFRAA